MRRAIVLGIFLLAACGDEARQPAATTGLVVFMGDSITAAWPVEDYVQGAVNVGVSGDETGQMLARFERDVLSRQPAVVVILGGINDIRNHATSDSGNLMTMVQQARAENIGVIVGTLPVATNLGADAALKRDLIEIFNDEIRAAADAHGYEIADYNKVTAFRGKLDPRKFPDGLHPNRLGCEAMWEALRPALERLGALSEES